MGVEGGQKNIDSEQKRIDLLDKTVDRKVGDKKSDIIFKRLDDFQKSIESSKVPEEVKLKQLKELGALLVTGKIENIELIDQELGEKLTEFEVVMKEMANPDLYQIKGKETLGKIVCDKLHVSLSNNPQLLFAGIKALQDYRDKHGSVLKVADDGSVSWNKGNSSPDVPVKGEYLDLKALNGLTSNNNEGIDYYISKTTNEKFKKSVEKLRRPDVDVLVQEVKVSKSDDAQESIDSSLMAGFADVDTASLGFGKIESRDDFQKMIDGMTTDAERKEFLDKIMAGLQEGQEAKEEPTEQQKLRLKQAELISNISLGISELFKESGGMAMKTLRFAGDEQSNARSAKKFVDLAQEFGDNASKKIMENPDKSLEELFPDVVKTFRHTGDSFLGGTVMGIPSIDFKEPKDVAELNTQRADVMRFLMSVSSYKMVDTIGQEALKEDFDKAKEKMSEEKKTEITAEANAKIAKDCEGYNAQWKEEGMTDEQITKFVGLMQAEQVDKDLTDFALLNHFDAKSLSADKMAVWDVYNETFDPQGEWLNITEDHYDYIVQEILINAPLIVASGAAGSMARGVLSTAARSFFAGSRLAIAYEAGNVAVRGAALAGGLLVEGTAFELTHNALAVQLGLEEKYLYEMPDALQKILWSSVTLGAFHGAGKVAEGVGKGIDQTLAKQVLKFKGIDPKEFKVVVDIIAKDISNTATRKVIQQLVVSGNIEAATMLMIGAVQNGFYTGNLDEFFHNFDEELFHAYTAVGALKTSGHMTGKALEGMRTKETYRDLTTEKPPVKGEEVVLKTEPVKETTSDKPSADQLKKNASLPPEQRVAKAQELLGRELSPTQKEAVLKAHEVGAGGEGKFTKAELLEKARILDEAGFSKEERRKLMEEGITGVVERVEASKGFDMDNVLSRDITSIKDILKIDEYDRGYVSDETTSELLKGNFEPVDALAKIKVTKDILLRDKLINEYKKNRAEQQKELANVAFKVRSVLKEDPGASYQDVLSRVFGDKMQELRFSKAQRVEIRKGILTYMEKCGTVKSYVADYKGRESELVAKIFNIDPKLIKGEVTLTSDGPALILHCDKEVFALLHSRGKEGAELSAGFATQRSEIPDLRGSIVVINNEKFKSPGSNREVTIGHELRHIENKLLFPPEERFERRYLAYVKDEIIAYMKQGTNPDALKKRFTEKDSLYDYYKPQRDEYSKMLSEAIKAKDVSRKEHAEKKLDIIELKWQSHCKRTIQLVDIAFKVRYLDMLSITPVAQWPKLLKRYKF